MELSVDINDVEEFVKSDKFSQFLLNNTTEFATAAFVLQAVFDKIDKLKGEK